jgi:mannose-6-phosphate isomerase-like protein (cupin superfamily)
MATTTTADAYSLRAGTGIADRWWKTGRVSVKASGAETGGGFSQVLTHDPRGTAPPLHLHHNEEETFYVLEARSP